MTTLTNMLVILFFVSALFTALGLLCGVADVAQAAVTRHYRRRMAERGVRRRRPRRRAVPASGTVRSQQALPAPAREGSE
jgi:hypothetical protein